MILRDTDTGGLQLYDISNNQITGRGVIGAVGLDWQFVGFAPIDGPGTRDLMMRNINTGQFQAYNITNDQITGGSSFGAIGLDWSVVGFGLTNGADIFHMRTRSVRDGGFEVYDISNNQITGAASVGNQAGSDLAGWRFSRRSSDHICGHGWISFSAGTNDGRVWLCRPGSSRRVSRPKPISCPPAADGCTRSSTMVFVSSPARTAHTTAVRG